MSTDTAFALGALALLTPRAATRTRVFLLSLAVVDDLGALVVIATVYTRHVSLVALAVAVAFFAVLLALRYAPAWRRPVSVAAAVGLWVAMFESGIDPVISGLAVGLATSAYPPSREDLERATALARSFREQPTPELAYSARSSLTSAISANERLQYRLHPWTSNVIVPLFALANAGIKVDGKLLDDAVGSPITLGILFGYVIGKPVGIMSAEISLSPGPLVRAVTVTTLVIGVPELVMKAFDPLITQSPVASSSLARVRVAPASLPPSGSVRPKAARAWPAHRSGNHRARCSSLP